MQGQAGLERLDIVATIGYTMTVMTKTYYHVTDRSWDGGDLLPYEGCADDCVALTDYARGVDPDVVCMYETLDEAIDHKACITPAGDILRITLTISDDTDHCNRPFVDGTDAAVLVMVEEDYPAVRGSVPARMCEVIG